jgi:hypothetical protein
VMGLPTLTVGSNHRRERGMARMSSLETGRASVFAGVFVQTNERGTNRVPAFRRGADGALEPAREYPTGGSGPMPITRPRKGR